MNATTTEHRINCPKCKGTHPTVREVRDCGRSTATAPASPQQPTVPAFASNPATERQVAFIKRLENERDWAAVDDHGGINTDTIMNVLDGKSISKTEASSAITYLLACNKTKEAGVLAAGMYKVGDDIFRVYLGQQSGQMLAKRIVGSKEEGYGFTYAGRADRFVTAANRMSLEEAKGWGKATESCCVCARRLDVPESVDAGIGPVCAGRMENDNWE